MIWRSGRPLYPAARWPDSQTFRGRAALQMLAAALEATMAEDAAQGRPLRAALCHARLAGDLPADGYFETAQALGRFDGSNRDQHVQSEPALLYKRQSGPSAC